VSFLARIPAIVEKRLRARIRQLEQDPHLPQFSKPMAEPKGYRSARVGDWRIIFTVDVAGQVIHILSIGSRDQVYRQV